MTKPLLRGAAGREWVHLVSHPEVMRLHTAFEVAIRLHDLQRAFEGDGARVIVVYEGTSWT